MSMEVTAWNAMYNAMHAARGRATSKATLQRIATFAIPHKRSLRWYLLLSVVTAALAVATPVLAGRVVNAIVGGDARQGRGEPRGADRGHRHTRIRTRTVDAVAVREHR